MGAQRKTRDDTPPHPAADGESRLVQLTGGMWWRVSVVARLVSEDIAAGRERARLVLQLDCLSARRRPLRAIVPGARALAEVSDGTIRAVIARPPLGRGARGIAAARKSRR